MLESISSELKVVGSHADLVQVWLWRNVCIFAWTGQVTGEATDELGRIVKRAIAMVPAGRRFSGVHLVPNKLEIPDAGGRSGLVQLLTTFSPHFGCIGILVGGVGFWASAIRSFITGLLVLVPGFDVRVVASLEELTSWLPDGHRKHTGVSIDPDELSQAVSACRSWQEEMLLRSAAKDDR